MKYKFMKINAGFLFSLLLAGTASCQASKKTQTPDTVATTLNTPARQEARPASAWNAAYVLDNNPDNAPPVQIRKAPEMVKVPLERIPVASTSRKAYLATGWWHCAMALSGTDSLIHLDYQPKWMKFREDQTFDILIKGQVVDTGRWTFDEDNMEIYLSCKDPYLNNVWKVQEKGFVMVFKGNTDINLTGIQIRVIGKKEQPKWD